MIKNMLHKCQCKGLECELLEMHSDSGNRLILVMAMLNVEGEGPTDAIYTMFPLSIAQAEMIGTLASLARAREAKLKAEAS